MRCARPPAFGPCCCKIRYCAHSARGAPAEMATMRSSGAEARGVGGLRGPGSGLAGGPRDPRGPRGCFATGANRPPRPPKMDIVCWANSSATDLRQADLWNLQAS